MKFARAGDREIIIRANNIPSFPGLTNAQYGECKIVPLLDALTWCCDPSATNINSAGMY